MAGHGFGMVSMPVKALRMRDRILHLHPHLKCKNAFEAVLFARATMADRGRGWGGGAWRQGTRRLGAISIRLMTAMNKVAPSVPPPRRRFQASAVHIDSTSGKTHAACHLTSHAANLTSAVQSICISIRLKRNIAPRQGCVGKRSHILNAICTKFPFGRAPSTKKSRGDIGAGLSEVLWMSFLG